MITIVSGLPRCGTSMMMQLLHAGGLPALTDHERKPDEDNPRGYFELEKVKKIRQDTSWLNEAEGKVFKMVSVLLFELPKDHDYRIIFMTRDLDEILASQGRMLTRMGKQNQPGKRSDQEMKQFFDLHLKEIQSWLAAQKNMNVLYCSYNDVMSDPAGHIGKIRQFLGVPLDAEKMKQSIDGTLYRNRAASSKPKS
jgi:hypothetical protein